MQTPFLPLLIATGFSVISTAATATPYQIPANHLFVGGGASVILPNGDFREIAEPSPGVTVQGGYWALESIALFAAIRYFRLNNAASVEGTPGLSLFSLGFGARWQPQVSRRLQPFVELEFGLHTARSSSSGLVSSESAIGGRGGIGLSLAIRKSLTLETLISFTRSDLEVSGTISGAILSLGLSTRL